MKSTKILIMLFISVLYLFGCSNDDEKVTEDIGAVITGEVVQIENDKFLVVEEQRVDNPEIWFTTDKIETLKVGLKVSVWSDDVIDGEGTAKRIEILE